MPARIVPDGIVEVVFQTGTPWSMRFGNEPFAPQPQAFAILQTRRSIELRPSGSHTAFVAVRFHPWGACQFLGVPPATFSDAAVPVDELWGRPATVLQERLFESETEAARVALVQAFLLDQLDRYERDDVGPLVRAIWSRQGRVRIDRLRRELGVGERWLERTFARTVGTSPLDTSESRIIPLRSSYTLSTCFR